ncbi:MAG TPA: MBL fold metallo-hydrolase [Deltaproteobacteria bacterium]|nr:MBL fold metallo-hydrolase [Deltaproteobacteria bacterium]HPJ93825.1 MBL fold metallo-hydrolase [Deltaproteobacteria bacterium]HPR52937.1 MBL fold metallo-hydrolase [Deltaproteobacteria bacterium]
MKINEVDKVEILTLQDNYIDITDMENSAVVLRANPLEGVELKNSVLAEHGFSAFIRTTSGNAARTMIFDFGFSSHGAAYNARVLGVDMGSVQALALSHGHMDHTGGFEAIVDMVGDRIDFVVHPGAFVTPRYLKFSEELKVYFPEFSKDKVLASGVNLIETQEPYELLGGDVVFLGQVPRQTDFEKGFPVAHLVKDGKEQWDPIEDDTAVVIHVKDKGLVVLSGCAHAGIVNTVKHAQEVTGIEKVHAVMGGFHLSGPLFEPIIERTTDELKKLDPDYIIPTHCTGRKAIMHIEKEMPQQFVLNMSGTQLTFSA